MMYICILLPTFISLEYTKNNKKNTVELIIDYGKYCSIINLIVLVLLMMMGKANQIFNESGTVRFYFLYLLSSIVLAYILPRIFNYLQNNVSFKAERLNNEKKKNHK